MAPIGLYVQAFDVADALRRASRHLTPDRKLHETDDLAGVRFGDEHGLRLVQDPGEELRDLFTVLGNGRVRPEQVTKIGPRAGIDWRRLADGVHAAICNNLSDEPSPQILLHATPVAGIRNDFVPTAANSRS